VLICALLSAENKTLLAKCRNRGITAAILISGIQIVANSFDCPSCGAAQQPPTTPVLSVHCRYCGMIVVVPEALRVQPAPAAQPPSLTINDQPVDFDQVAPARTRRGILGCGGCGCFISLLFTIGFAGFMIYIFGFSIKSSVLYRCAVQLAQRNSQVINLIGAPITADTFAWISNYESSGDNETGQFTTQLSGPEGSGILSVDGSHDRRSTDLDITFAFASEFVQVHSGAAECK